MTRYRTGMFVGMVGLFIAAAACNSVTGATPGAPDGAGGDGGDAASGGGAFGGGASGGGTAGGGGCDGQVPVAVAPASGTTVAGPQVTLEWAGGLPPYEVEIAFDQAFTDPVPGLSPITTDQTSVDVSGLAGGFFYWRVRSLGGCGADPSTDPAELHVTCSPVRLTETPDVTDWGGAIDWNPHDKEYGITLTRGSPEKIYFVRVDRLGKVLFGPTEITGASLPPVGGGYQSHSLAYVESTDRWTVTYHREGADQAYVTLFDDSATALQTFELYDGFDSESQSVSYHPDADMIVTSNDAAGDPWTTQVHRFSASLQPISPVTNASQGSSDVHDGLAASIVALPGFDTAGHYALAAFEYRHSINPLVYQLMVQLVRLGDGEIMWPLGSQHPTTAGKQVVNGVRLPRPMMAWNPLDQVVGLAYARDNDTAWSLDNDVFFTIVNPTSGAAMGSAIHLNAAAPKTTAVMYVKVAWDGEEFLVMWDDARTGPEGRDLRLTKLSGLGSVLAGGDRLYQHAGAGNWVNGGPARSIVGHDRIHSMVYSHRDAGSTTWDAWLCIEPAYE